MSGWDKEIDLGFRGFAIAAAVAAVAVIAWTILLGSRARSAPSRCPIGLEQSGARCCAPGQWLSDGHCVGPPQSCPNGMEPVEAPQPGCVQPAERIAISGGSLTLGPTDWDSVNVVKKHIVAVRSFQIDQIEVTTHRYQECVRAGLCSAVDGSREPGLPVTSITAQHAEAFCAFAGGRLPTPEEWIFAAAGAEARRFPWGAHGLVCRRAAYGLRRGPCSEGGTTADLAGARPDGKTPEGVLDLAGNVAELSRSARGVVGVHGGSFRSEQASELKSWSSGAVARAADVGFRCVYAAH